MPNTNLAPIIARTLEKISKRLDHLVKNTTAEPTEKIIYEVLHTPIYDAFTEVSNNDRRKLYVALSLKLHPDQLPDNIKDQYAIRLNGYIDRVRDKNENTKLRQIAQRLINENKEFPSFTEFLQNQPEALKASFEIFQAKFYNFFNEYLRYPIYLRNFIYFTQAFINVILIIACVFVCISVMLIILIAGVSAFIEKNILSWLLSNHYQDLLNEELTEAKLAAYYKNKVSSTKAYIPGAPDFSAETDAQMLEHFRNEKRQSFFQGDSAITIPDEALNVMIREEVEFLVTMSFYNWNFVLNAVYRATIADPQSGFILNNLYRIFVLLSLIPLLILKGSFCLVSTSAIGVLLAALIILATIKLGSTLLFNAPLYVYDLFLLCFKNDEKDEKLDDEKLDVESRSRWSSQALFANNEELNHEKLDDEIRLNSIN